jgi:ubiquinol-cytochrome c reductase cytochrome c1 subunit
MARLAALVLTLLIAPLGLAAEPAAGAAQEAAAPMRWDSWRAGNDVADTASLQRGARNFMNYCIGCHSLKYMRYQRMASDLKIPTAVLNANLLAPGSTNLDYILTSMPAADSATWFGKTPPDLSLIARSRSPDYIYRFLKTFYADPSRSTRSDNLAYPGTAMPAVLSGLEGVKAAVFLGPAAGAAAAGAEAGAEKQFDHFESIAPGTLTPEQYDGFVRDTVNFLDYVGEPAQVERRSMGIWVVLFLLLLSAVALALKREYWKDVH